jgi:drug/metabolite transporter superfamily protein YnfA
MLQDDMPAGWMQFTNTNLLPMRQTRMNVVNQLVQSPLGAFAFLTIAAVLESFGDSCFQAAMYHSVGRSSATAAISGAVVLVAYGVMVNLPRWDFGRLIGIYVAVFFISAQVINRLRFGHAPSPPIYAGGALIVAGGLVMTLWKA